MAGRKKRINPVIKVIFAVELLAIAGILIFIYGKKVIVKKAADQVVETVATQVIKEKAAENGISEQEVDQIIDSVDEEDRQKVEEIVADHMDAETIDKGMEYAESGDTEGLKAYLDSELTPEESQELMEMYEKYAAEYSDAGSN